MDINKFAGTFCTYANKYNKEFNFSIAQQRSNNTSTPRVLVTSKDKAIKHTFDISDMYEEIKTAKKQLMDKCMEKYIDLYIDTAIDEAISSTIYAEQICKIPHVSEKLFMCPVNAVDNNEDKMQDILHKDIFDMAFMASIIDNVNTMENGNVSMSLFPVPYTFKNIIKMTQDSLIETALKNTERHFPARVMPLITALEQAAGPGSPWIHDTCPHNKMDIPLLENVFMITNNIRTYGATAVLYKDMLYKISLQVGNFYMMPSSIHEMIIAKDDGQHIENFLTSNNIVREINNMCVENEEKLSDTIYYYDGKHRHLKVVNGGPEYCKQYIHI